MLDSILEGNNHSTNIKYLISILTAKNVISAFVTAKIIVSAPKNTDLPVTKARNCQKNCRDNEPPTPVQICHRIFPGFVLRFKGVIIPAARNKSSVLTL